MKKETTRRRERKRKKKLLLLEERKKTCFLMWRWKKGRKKKFFIVFWNSSHFATPESFFFIWISRKAFARVKMKMKMRDFPLSESVLHHVWMWILYKLSRRWFQLIFQLKMSFNCFVDNTSGKKRDIQLYENENFSNLICSNYVI